MPEKETPPQKPAEESINHPGEQPEDRPAAEQAKGKKRSKRYELKVKEERRKAEEKIKDLRLGKATTRHISPIEAEDLAAAKSIVEKSRTNKDLEWLIKGNIPDDPIVLDVLARIASAPAELRNDPRWLIAVGSELQGAIRHQGKEELFAIVGVMANIREEATRLLGFKSSDIVGMRKAVKEAENSKDPDKLDRARHAELANLATRTLSEIGLMGAVGPPPGPVPPDWLTFENQPAVPMHNPDLVRIVGELRAMGDQPDWREVKAKWRELQALTPALAGTDRDWSNGYGARVFKTFQAMTGNRINALTPKEVFDLTRGPNAAELRDREFYRRVKKVLFDPNEETQKQLNLYDQADIDTFMEVISNSEALDSGTGDMKNIGKEVVANYRNKLDTILRLSDFEYWARHSSGDVENLTKSKNYFENKFSIEALSDPLVEDMVQCYEMAIKINRDNNEDFMPSELARYDPRTQTTPIDELTLLLFRERMDSGSIRDYVRDPVSGKPELDPATGKTTFLRSDEPFDQGTLSPEELELKLFATLRMAKGISVLTGRTIELYAFTRTPGVDVKLTEYDHSKSFEQSIAVFSSKPYGGLTRWINPMSEWFRMFGFGDTLFVPFFNTIIGDKRSAGRQSYNWNMSQAIDAMNVAASGDRKQLEAMFGKGVNRIMDLLGGTSKTGRFGPGSMWGIKDATQGWDAKKLERLGGSERLTLARSWAEEAVKKEFNNTHAGLEGVALEDARSKALIGEGHEGKKWKEKIDKKERAYKTWIWLQTVMRNPQGIASHIRVEYGTAQDRPQGDPHPLPFKGKLRSKIMYKIFNDQDLQHYKLENNHGEPKKLIIERDVATGNKITGAKRDLAARIAIIDADMGAVMRYAMNKGAQPRDIKDSYFVILKGDRELYVEGQRVVVTEARRREQAREYFKEVQRELLGKAIGDAGPAWDVDRWRSELGAPPRLDVKPDEVTFTNEDAIDDLLPSDDPAHPHPIHHNILMTKEFVNEPLRVHFGTEDVQWGYLDLDSLGDRHWGRQGNDELTRAKTEMLLMKHFHNLTGKPKMEDLVKSIQEIGMQEKDFDPKEAAKFASLWAEGTHSIYRQRKLAGVPIIGRILPSFNVPMSIAQEKLGVHSATFWSMNNSVQFADQIGATRVIPNKRIVDGRDYGEFTMQKLRKEMGASRVLAIVEMFIIGYAIAALATSVTAVTKSAEEDNK